MRLGLGFTGPDRVLANWTALLAEIPELGAELLLCERIRTGRKQFGTDRAGRLVTFRGVVLMTVAGNRIHWTRFYLEPMAEPDDR